MINSSLHPRSTLLVYIFGFCLFVMIVSATNAMALDADNKIVVDPHRVNHITRFDHCGPLGSDPLAKRFVIEGNTAVFSGCSQGMSDFPPGPPYLGGISIYEQTNNQRGITWEYSKSLRSSEIASGDGFGSWGRFDLFEDTLVVGASYEDGGEGDPALDSGAVYVFERNLGGDAYWGEASILRPSFTAPNILFGTQVRVHQDTIVGASLGDGTRNYTVFQRSPTNRYFWFETKTISVPSGGSLESTAFALDAEKLAISSGYSIKIYGRNHGGLNNWGLEASLLTPGSDTDNDFGVALDLSENTLAVGAPLQNEVSDPVAGLTALGTVYVFDRSPSGEWLLTGQINEESIYSTQIPVLEFGTTLALDADYLLVGAQKTPSWPPYEFGSIHLYQRDPQASQHWVNIYETGNGDFPFGSVALSGNSFGLSAIYRSMNPRDEDFAFSSFYSFFQVTEQYFVPIMYD